MISLECSTAAVEFRAVAAHSRATNPHLHLVTSRRDGEHPMNFQAFQAGRAALAALGLVEHQYVMAVHREETGSDHFHVAVNRVHPETYWVAHLSKSYCALDRAMPEIELRQRWERDDGPNEVRIARTVLRRSRASTRALFDHCASSKLLDVRHVAY